MKNKKEREIESLERARDMLIRNFSAITSVTVNDGEDYGPDLTVNGSLGIEVKSHEIPLKGNRWFSTTSGYSGAVRHRKNDQSSGYTLDELEKNPYDYDGTGYTYVYGFPPAVYDKFVTLVNLDCKESPVDKCKYSKLVRNHIPIIFEFDDCWALFRWSDLEKARVCNIEMLVRTGHTKEFGGSHKPVWERKTFLDLSKAKIIDK